jgi:hypothetical protein
MTFADFLLSNEFSKIRGITFNIRDWATSQWLETFMDPTLQAEV